MTLGAYQAYSKANMKSSNANDIIQNAFNSVGTIELQDPKPLRDTQMGQLKNTAVVQPRQENKSAESATVTTEESFFAKNKTAIIVVGCFALAGTAYYFYTKKNK